MIMNNLLLKRQQAQYKIEELESSNNSLIAEKNIRSILPELRLEGNTTQIKYSGKNLCDEIFEYGQLYADTGNEYISSSAQTSIITKNFIAIKPSTAYTMTNGLVNVNRKHRFYDANFNYIGYNLTSGSLLASDGMSLIQTGTTPVNAYYLKFELDFPDIETATAVKNGEYKYMLELGTKGTSYEPFTGGRASPNPLYPQPLNIAGRDGVEISIKGYNRFNEDYFSQLPQVEITTYEGETCFKFIPTTVNYYIPIDFPEVETWFCYEFDLCHPHSGADYYWFVEYEDGTNRSFAGETTTTPPTNTNFIHYKNYFQIPKKVKRLDLRFFALDRNYTYYIKNFMITSSPVIAWKPYQPYFNYNIAIPNTIEKDGKNISLNFARLNDTYDVLEVDSLNRKVTYKQRLAYVNLYDSYIKGTKINIYSYSGATGVYFEKILPTSQYRATGTGTHSSYYGTNLNDKEFFWIGVNNQYLYWVGVLDKLGLTTVDEFKEWLTNEGERGSPPEIIYILPDNEDHKLSDFEFDLTDTELGNILLSIPTGTGDNIFTIYNSSDTEQKLNIKYLTHA